MAHELNVNEKREIIYLGERLKAIIGELAELSAERNAFANVPAENENEKRRRIYIAERLVRLGQERASLLTQRDMLNA